MSCGRYARKHMKSSRPEADEKEEEVRQDVVEKTIQEGQRIGPCTEHELKALVGPASSGSTKVEHAA